MALSFGLDPVVQCLSGDVQNLGDRCQALSAFEHTYRFELELQRVSPLDSFAISLLLASIEPPQQGIRFSGARSVLQQAEALSAIWSLGMVFKTLVCAQQNHVKSTTYDRI